MELVIDANVVISALIASSGKTCDLMFSDRLRLYAPEFLSDEIDKHKAEICKKSKLVEVELDLAFALIFSRITLVPHADFSRHLSKAENICPDPDDTEYFALASRMGCPIWSNDKALKKQDSIRVISTHELLKLL
jgi:predicted nucleic acid-binding protein